MLYPLSYRRAIHGNAQILPNADANGPRPVIGPTHGPNPAGT